jgi:hypothetical protein
MDKIIESVKKKPGYQRGSLNIQIVYDADDAVLIADSEEKLQELLNQFCITAKTYNIAVSTSKTKTYNIAVSTSKTKTYNIAVSTSKTKTLTISKEPVQCKLVIDGTFLE